MDGGKRLWVWAQACLLLCGCGATPDPALGGSEHVAARQTAALDFRQPQYDDGSVNQCVFNNLSMHCCPGNHPGDSRWVMIGAHVLDNVFKCVELEPPTYAPPFVDGPDGNTFTVRENMHACPLNSVMAGFHEGQNDLICIPLSRAMTESVDYGLQDEYPMHVCPEGQAMSGIHVDENRFLCAE